MNDKSVNLINGRRRADVASGRFVPCPFRPWTCEPRTIDGQDNNGAMVERNLLVKISQRWQRSCT